MEDIVFKPKYKPSFWFFTGVVVLIALAVLAAAVMMTLAAGRQQRAMTFEETVMAASFFGIFAVLALCIFNTVMRGITIGGGGISVRTMLGTVKRRPFSPVAYYEDGCFIINGYIFANNFISNLNEIDAAFKKLSLAGKIEYIRERGILSSRYKAPVIIVLVLSCVGGIALGQSIGSLDTWMFVLFIDVTALAWLALSFNKLPRAGKKVWQTIKRIAEQQ